MSCDKIDPVTYSRRIDPTRHAKLRGARACLESAGGEAERPRRVPRRYENFMASASKSGDNAGGGTQFLTVAEVASLMRVSKMTVYRLVHNGELPAVRVGRSFRVHAKAVHDYLETSYFDAG